MSVETVSAIHKAAVDICWRQWAVLNPLLTSAPDRPLHSLIDPEALLLLSSCMMDEERRLVDAIDWWASTGSTLISGQRLRSLARRFPPQAQKGIGLFAAKARAAGDYRWIHESGNENLPRSRSGKGSRIPDLRRPAALWLRLRAGFGINVKIDILACLIGMQGAPLTIKDLASATGYTMPALRAAAQGMALAGIVQETRPRPATYRVNGKAWITLLTPENFSQASAPDRSENSPRWFPWGEVFALLIDSLAWATNAGRISDYLLSSQARDLYEQHGAVIERYRLPVPDPSVYSGTAYRSAFDGGLQALITWIDRHL